MTLPPDDQPPRVVLVRGEPAEALAAVGELSMTNPVAVAFAFLLALDERAPGLAKLQQFVTPEWWNSRPNFRELADAMHDVGIGTVPQPALGSDDVVYVGVHSDPGGDVMQVEADEPVLIMGRAVISLQRRPDLGGEWRVHYVGDYVRPEEMPPT